MIAVEVRNLTTQYGSKVIHDDISFSIQKNSICTIIGGSGSGKTTLLKIMLGLKPPSQGIVKVLEQEINDLSPKKLQSLRKRTSVLFQEGALFSGLTVEDNIIFPLQEILDLDKDTKKSIVNYWLTQVGLELDVAPKMPSELSGGMKKRVGLARALVLEPELIFLDEPTSGLDPISARNFDVLIKNLQQQIGMTIVIISHDITSIKNLSDQIIALRDKKVIEDGPLSQIIESGDEWVNQYFNNHPSQTENGIRNTL